MRSRIHFFCLIFLGWLLSTSCQTQNPVAFGSRKFYPDKVLTSPKQSVQLYSQRQVNEVVEQAPDLPVSSQFTSVPASPDVKHAVGKRTKKLSLKERFALNILKRKMGHAHRKVHREEVSLEENTDQKDPVTGLLLVLSLASIFSIVWAALYVIKLLVSVGTTNDGSSPVWKIISGLGLILLLLLLLGFIFIW